MPEEPALHLHSDTVVLAAGESELAGQRAHNVAPSAVEYLPAPQAMQLPAAADCLYFPASHCVHMPPFGPAKPALHLHLVNNKLPAGETESAGQGRHSSLEK